MEWIRKRLWQSKFENIKHDSRNYFGSPASKGKFEVEFFDTTHVVDMGAWSFHVGCGIWLAFFASMQCLPFK